MKIMFYINTLGLGGAERVITNLATQFYEHDYDVVMVNSFCVNREYFISDKIKRYVLEEIEYNGNKLFKNIKRILSLRKICKQEKPDVIISFMVEANIRAIISTFGLPIKTIVSVRNDPNREYKGLLGWFVGKFLLPLANGCVFQTEEAKKWFPKKLQEKSVIILNPVSERFFETEYKGIRKNIVTTGRLVKQKNHELLIRAFASIANNIEENLIIYGEGSERCNLEELISELNMSERIFLPGSVEDVSGTIKSAKLYVLSSDFEGMPNGLMEAMALGLPCISTDCPCGGPRELIENEVNGLLIPVNNDIALSDTILKILNNENLKRIISVAAKIKAKSFRLNTVFLQWKEYMNSI